MIHHGFSSEFENIIMIFIPFPNNLYAIELNGAVHTFFICVSHISLTYLK